MTAEDVVFSFDRAMAEGSINAQKQLFDGINEVTAIDDRTVEIALDAPKGVAAVQPRLGRRGDRLAGDAPTPTPPTRSAPGRSASRSGCRATGSSSCATTTTGATAPALEKVDLPLHLRPHRRLRRDDGGRSRRLPGVPGAGEPARSSPPTRASRSSSARPRARRSSRMNNARPPFDDVRVREAIAHAIDRQAIIDGAMFGYGTPIGSHFAPHHPAYDDLTGALGLRSRRRRKALLAEAGLRGRLHHHADAAAAGLCAARRRDRRGAAARGRHRGRDHQRRMGAVARAGVHRQGLRPDHHQPHRADGHRHLRPRRLLLRLRRPGDAGADGRASTPPPTRTSRRELLQAAQERIAERYVNAFLFQLAKTGVADARIEGLWENSPTQANDVTGVSWQ